MSFVAVAIGGSALIGGIASIAGGNAAAGAQRDASATNAGLTQQQIAEDRRQYDQNRADLAPYRDVGYGALSQLARGTAVGGEFNRDFTMADFTADPGYAFRQAEGNKALENSASARGGVLSGGTLKAITKYNQDAASQEYGAAYGRFNNDLTTRYNRLAGLAGTGQTATNSGIAAGQALSGQTGALTGQLIDSNNAGANARASQYVNTAGAIGNAANSAGQYFALKNIYGTGGGFNPYAAGYEYGPAG